MSATMYGCEIVCSSPIGSAWSPYARSRSASSTKRWRGTPRLAAAEPVVRAAAGILLLDDLVAVDAVPEPRETDAARRLRRHVDVDQRLAWKPRDEHAHRDETRRRRGVGEIPAVEQRDRDRG